MKLLNCIVCFFCLLLIVALPFSFGDETSARDPFQSNITPVLTTSQGEQPAINAVLQGISIGPKKSFAVINGMVLYEGEEKNGIKVTQIRKREVDILVNGIIQTLQMVIHDRPPQTAPMAGQMDSSSGTPPGQPVQFKGTDKAESNKGEQHAL